MDCCLPCDRSTAHRSRWQDLELIFLRLLQHGNRHARGESIVFASLRPAETFMRAYTRPTEAVCCRNERFLRYAYAARFRVIQTRKRLCDWRIFRRRKRYYACVSYTMMQSVLLRWTPSLNHRSKLKGECTDVKSGCGTSVGPSLNPHSLS